MKDSTMDERSSALSGCEWILEVVGVRHDELCIFIVLLPVLPQNGEEIVAMNVANGWSLQAVPANHASDSNSFLERL